MADFTELLKLFPWPKQCPDLPPDLEHGWCAGPVREYFRKFLSPRTRLILELGSWLGLSARHMLELAPNANMICVDHWRGSEEHHRTPRQDVKQRLPILHQQFIRNMWPYRHRLVAIKAEIQMTLRQLAKLKINPNLIFVDGSHDARSVCADTQASCRLFPEATVMGDDYCWDSVAEGLRHTGYWIEHNKVAWVVRR